MNKNVTKMDIAGRQCHIFMEDFEAPYIYWFMQPHAQQEAILLKKYLDETISGKKLNLIAIEVKNWNAELSPWPALAVYGKESFTGGARDTLQWLIKSGIPLVEQISEVKQNKRMIAGYSLAGLFSIWSFFESRLFDGVVSCSGSLWYPGWSEYAKNVKAPEGSIVYLSLGRKEEFTRNPQMSLVGDATRRMAKLLEQDTGIFMSNLEWNPGGHFQKPLERMTKGIAWALRHLKT